jgi:hypothetical protein
MSFKVTGLALVVTILSLSPCTTICQSRDESDQQQIQALIEKLVSHEPVQGLLDPLMPVSEREKQTRPFAISYDITLVPEGPIQVSGTTAKAPMRLTFENSSATSHEQMEESIHLDLVKRNGQWYFANYDFLKSSLGEILAFIGAMLIAVTWGFGTLRKMHILRKKRSGPFQVSGFISDYFQAINPLTWFRKS